MAGPNPRRRLGLRIPARLLARDLPLLEGRVRLESANCPLRSLSSLPLYSGWCRHSVHPPARQRSFADAVVDHARLARLVSRNAEDPAAAERFLRRGGPVAAGIRIFRPAYPAGH